MRGASHYYLAQTWRPRGYRQIQQDARRRRAVYQARHALADAPARGPVRELPGVARRVLAVLSGTS